MNSHVLLEWTYSPANFLESPVEIKQIGYELKMDEGKVEARIDPSVYDAEPSLRQQLHGQVLAQLQAVQLTTLRTFELSSSSKTVVRADGSKHHFLEVKSIVAISSVSSPNLVVRDSSGRVTFDSKQERIVIQKQLAQQIKKHDGDEVLEALLRSFYAALDDPNNELVHLYEVRETLKTKLGGDKKAKSILSITQRQYSRFGELCNELPLKQGRHRGKAYDELRDATAAELDEARKIAREMIEAYLDYLERSQVGPVSQ